MRAVTVCVDYSDFLKVTLPWNRHHFEEVLVVTTAHDTATIRVAASCGARIVLTDAFYRDGAAFNKWLALEEGLDAFGRRGWLCFIDPDVLWPKDTKFLEGRFPAGSNSYLSPSPGICGLKQGTLTSPRRRLWLDYAGQPAPLESEWSKFPLEEYQGEHAGYSQIFHASDPALRECARCGYLACNHDPSPLPGACSKFVWHETNWRHAGGADSFFQMRWASKDKVRPPFECLHLGTPGVNWCGRTEEQKRQLREYIEGRKQHGFAKEKL